MMNLHVVSEAPTPHNNFFFGEVGEARFSNLFLYYLYKPDSVPGRPWKTLTDKVGQGHVRSGVNKYFDFRLISRVVGKCRDDVLFVIGWNHPTLVFLVLCAAIRRAPLLMWFDTPKLSQQGLSLGKWARGVVKSVLVRAINRAPSVIFVTGNEALARLESLGIKKDRFCVLPFFVGRFDKSDEELNELHERLRTRYRCAASAKLFVAAGRLIHSKGFDVLVDALAQIRSQGKSGWILVLVGSGPESDYLKAKIEHYQMNDVVQLIPWMEYKEFQETIAGCDVFIAPARFDPFPTTVLMAMGYGKAVIASDQTFSAVDFIEHRQSGMLFRSGDVEALAGCLTEVLENIDHDIMSRLAKRAAAKWPVERGVALVREAATRLVEM